MTPGKVKVDYDSGTSVEHWVSDVTIRVDANEVSIYKEKGNSNVYELRDFFNNHHVSIGRYLRTDWRS